MVQKAKLSSLHSQIKEFILSSQEGRLPPVEHGTHDPHDITSTADLATPRNAQCLARGTNIYRNSTSPIFLSIQRANLGAWMILRPSLGFHTHPQFSIREMFACASPHHPSGAREENAGPGQEWSLRHYLAMPLWRPHRRRGKCQRAALASSAALGRGNPARLARGGWSDSAEEAPLLQWAHLMPELFLRLRRRLDQVICPGMGERPVIFSNHQCSTLKQ
jgi:hypothetical protein